MNEELKAAAERILLAIQRDITNILVRASGTAVLDPDSQDALIKYYKLLLDARLANKERELEEKILLAEEALARGAAPKS